MSDGVRVGILITLGIHVLLAVGVIGLSVGTGSRPLPERTPAQVEQLLDGVLEKYRAEMSKPMGCGFGRNEGIWWLYLKARLITLAHPNIVEGLLLERAVDPSRAPHARALSIAMLGELYRTGRTNLEATLLSIATGPEPAFAAKALSELASVDTTGRFLELYRSMWRLKSWSPHEALSCWHNQTTIQDMEQLAMDQPRSTEGFMAGEVLARLRILASPECDKTLERIVEGGINDDRFEWALKVARMRSMPGLLEALQRRLTQVESPLSPGASEEERFDYDRMVKDGFNPVGNVAAGHYITADPNFDDALTVYAELGGELTGAQRRRLTLFGYVGDPRARLEELLNSGK